MQREEILQALHLGDSAEALERMKYLDAKGHFSALTQDETKEWQWLEEYFRIVEEDAEPE